MEIPLRNERLYIETGLRHRTYTWLKLISVSPAWWRDHMEIYLALLALIEGNVCVYLPLFYYNDVMMSALTSQIQKHLDCLLNHLFRRRSNDTSKLRVTGLCEGSPQVTGGIPSQKACKTENVFLPSNLIHCLSNALEAKFCTQYLRLPIRYVLAYRYHYIQMVHD